MEQMPLKFKSSQDKIIKLAKKLITRQIEIRGNSLYKLEDLIEEIKYYGMDGWVVSEGYWNGNYRCREGFILVNDKDVSGSVYRGELCSN